MQEQLTVLILDQDICHIGLILGKIVKCINGLINKFKVSHYQLIIFINIIIIIQYGKIAIRKYCKARVWWKGEFRTSLCNVPTSTCT